MAERSGNKNPIIFICDYNAVVECVNVTNNLIDKGKIINRYVRH